MSRFAFKILLFAVIFVIYLLFSYLSKKHKGEEKEATYRGIAEFFASLPMILMFIGLILFILLIIFVEF